MAPRSRPDWKDYSSEMRLLGSKPLRMLCISLSTLLLLIGIIGVFMPVLPTTPFVLASAALFARSSPRFYNALMNHGVLGPPLRQWREHGRITRRSKIIALTMLGITLIPSILFFVPILAVKLLLACIGVAVAWFIATRPS